MEATEAYRKVLSEAEDNSVVISAIGFATNIRNLLQSGGDQYRYYVIHKCWYLDSIWLRGHP